MSVISLRVGEKEKKILMAYAKHHNKTVSEVIRDTMIKHIENEYDLKIFEEFEMSKKLGKLKTRPIAELWGELNV